MKTAQFAIDAAGAPPTGFRAMPVDFGTSFFWCQVPVIENGTIMIAPAAISSFPDWRVYFIPDDV
jgi:hypothetical protein